MQDERTLLRDRVARVLDEAASGGVTDTVEVAEQVILVLYPYLQAERSGAWAAGHAKGCADAQQSDT